MIKQLIEDIAFQKIKLSDALTRAKLIAFKIKNETFNKWIAKELQGYERDDSMLPEYRNVKVDVFLQIYDFGVNTLKQVVVDEKEFSDFYNLVHFHQIFEGLSIVEDQFSRIISNSVTIDLTIGQREALFQHLVGKEFFYARYVGMITGGYKEFSRTIILNVFEQIKQRLLDILLQLDSEFPNLENEYKMTPQNSDKANNIITNNIYGNQNPVNIASGQNINQSIEAAFTAADMERLEGLGVGAQETKELKTIVENTPKSDRKTPIMKWLGSVASSMAARGIYDNFSEVSEIVGNLF